MKKIVALFILLVSQNISAQTAEVKWLDAINTKQIHPNSDVFFKGVSSSSYIISVIAPTSIFAVSLVKRDKSLRRQSYQMATGLGLSMSISLALKYIVDRPRPSETYSFIYPRIIKDSPSFPSGHATAAFETATSLSMNFPKWYVIVPSYVWAGAVSYSRMYLGVHYPSDVLAGALLGASSAWLSYKINKICLGRKVKKEFPSTNQ